MSREMDWELGIPAKPVGKKWQKYPVTLHLTLPEEKIHMACVGWQVHPRIASAWQSRLQELYDFCKEDHARLVFSGLRGKPRVNRLSLRNTRGTLRHVLNLNAVLPKVPLIRFGLVRPGGEVRIRDWGNQQLWSFVERKRKITVLLGRSMLYGLNRYLDMKFDD